MPTAPDMSTVEQLEITEVVSAQAETREHKDDDEDDSPVAVEDDSNPCGVVLERCVMKFQNS